MNYCFDDINAARDFELPKLYKTSKTIAKRFILFHCFFFFIVKLPIVENRQIGNLLWSTLVSQSFFFYYFITDVQMCNYILIISEIFNILKRDHLF